ncbi:P2Y purinoceptor 14-like [Cheilinus undulatus]|uniref:P2Y purinoceptor 14-like n=1 Tax=Cheilinus undulatus TaxID=241271 RepID=UPI001BD3674C|nr:P2Y purinoceptor 14-like [Cheilinus undulatus]
MMNLERIGVTLSLVYNQTNDTSSSHCEQIDTSGRFFFIVVYSLVFLVGLLLNGFTLKFNFCSAQEQASSSMTIYLKNLAAADFLISLCLPVRISHFATRSVTIFRVYCNFGASAFYLNMYASMLFMGYIAANRYLKIIRPLGTNIRKTVRPANIISTLTWLFLLASAATYTTITFLTDKLPPSVPNIFSCNSLHRKQVTVFYKVLHSCCSALFLIVFVSLVFFYYSTSRRVAMAEDRKLGSSGSKRLAKSRRNMLVLVFVFCVCFVPYHLVRLPYTFLEIPCSWGQVFFYLRELALMMSILTVCWDPLLYFIYCKGYRAQLKKSIRRRRR